MLNHVNVSDLGLLSEQDRRAELGALVEHARTANGSADAYLRSRIHAFELRYEMTSEDLQIALREGRQEETAEVAEWLFLLNALGARGR